MANILTGIRIICGVLILCFPAFSGWYYCLYLLGGFTDAVDGTVARKTGNTSDFGSKFDTAADFIFAAAVGVKILSTLYLPLWLMIWIAAIALVKIGSHLTAYAKCHEFKTDHSMLNKVCGGVTFIIPLFMGSNFPRQSKTPVIIAACVLASVGAVFECAALLNRKTD